MSIGLFVHINLSLLIDVWEFFHFNHCRCWNAFRSEVYFRIDASIILLYIYIHIYVYMYINAWNFRDITKYSKSSRLVIIISKIQRKILFLHLLWFLLWQQEFWCKKKCEHNTILWSFSDASEIPTNKIWSSVTHVILKNYVSDSLKRLTKLDAFYVISLFFWQQFVVCTC